MSEPGAHRPAAQQSAPSSAAPTSARGATAAAVGLWVVVAAGLAYGVSQALRTAGKLFGG